MPSREISGGMNASTPSRSKTKGLVQWGFYKRTTGLEPATFGLGSRRSTN